MVTPAFIKHFGPERENFIAKSKEETSCLVSHTSLKVDSLVGVHCAIIDNRV